MLFNVKINFVLKKKICQFFQNGTYFSTRLVLIFQSSKLKKFFLTKENSIFYGDIYLKSVHLWDLSLNSLLQGTFLIHT